jgi:hypothetical protein
MVIVYHVTNTVIEHLDSIKGESDIVNDRLDN